MKTYLQAYFDLLKAHVLEKSEITQIVPADCYRLTLEIKAKTNRSISETTLKRVFGFASSVHSPSIYTLNALAEYCGFDGWDHFYTHIEQCKSQSSVDRTWGEISLNAIKISLFTIQSNKHSCGIPYHQTIDREHMDTFMEHFHRSGATIGILSGPTGYGKTIAMSRWVERRINENRHTANHDIYLFTNSLSLLQSSAYSYHANRWLAHLLGFDSCDLLDDFMENYRVKAHGYFYLIIDEIHNDLVPDRQFYNVINQFIEMVRNFAQYDWFRIILTLRTSTLLKYENLFRHTIINPQWFSILSGSKAGELADMPAFSDAELNQLIGNIRGTTTSNTPMKHRHNKLIHIPLFFQYHYELTGKNLDSENVTVYSEYAIITQYLKKMVFNGINTLAKQCLLEELAALADEHDNTLQVSKRQVYTVIKHYRTAYNDLLYCGILQEENCGSRVRQQNVIRFQTQSIAAYFIALQLYNSHEDIEQLINVLNRSAVSNKVKIEQLKWLLLFHIETGDLRLVNQLANIPFLVEDKAEIAGFICDALHTLSTKATPCIRTQINMQLYDNSFVDHVLNDVFFLDEHESNLAKLLDFELSEKHEILLRCRIAFIALLKWDEEIFNEQLEMLSEKRPEAYICFAVNPLVILNYLSQSFKGKKNDLQFSDKLDDLYHRLQHSSGLITNQLIDVLVYLVVKISGRGEIAHRYKDIIRRRVEPITLRDINGELTRLIYTLYIYECNNGEKITDYITRKPLNHRSHVFYCLLRNILLMLAEKQSKGSDCLRFGKQAIAICEIYGFKLLEIYCRLLILDEIPKSEQSYQVNSLKFQLTAFGYTTGLNELSRKYG